jgi:hypothetical protein
LLVVLGPRDEALELVLADYESATDPDRAELPARRQVADVLR